jgi:hypothetical protein
MSSQIIFRLKDMTQIIFRLKDINESMYENARKNCDVFRGLPSSNPVIVHLQTLWTKYFFKNKNCLNLISQCSLN